MLRRRRPQLKRRHPLELLWPFLLLILIGIILVLLIQFVMTWFDQRQTDLKNKMYFYLDRGVASVLPWGQTEWAKAYHGQLVLEGDVLRMGRLSRGVLAFFDDSEVRMEADTKLEIDSIKPMERGEGDQVYLALSSGQIWLASGAGDDAAAPLQFVVNTDHLRVTSYGTVFEVGSTDRETVRVMEGEALVEILEEGKDRKVVVEQVKVGVGQQVEITAKTLEAIYARQPVTLLEALSDEWKGGEWYQWNQENVEYRIKNEEGGQGAEGAVIAEGEADVEVGEETESESQPAESLEPSVVSITSPAESLVVFKGGKEEVFTISGTATETTARVVVTSYDANGVGSPYALKGYKAGAGEWSYRASYAYGNLREGRNKFTVAGEDANGVKGAAVEVIVEVPVGTFSEKKTEGGSQKTEGEQGTEEQDGEATTDAAEASEEANASTGESGASSEIDEEQGSSVADAPSDLSDEPLTPPRVVSLNGSPLPADARLSTGAESILVVGAVSTSTSAVYVNKFKLTKYVAGSGEWSYVIRPEFGNYDAGNNTYTVVAEDAEGNKESFVFEVYRVAP